MLMKAICRSERDALLKRRWTALLAGEAGTKRTGGNYSRFEISKGLMFSMLIHICICVYIYIHICWYIVYASTFPHISRRLPISSNSRRSTSSNGDFFAQVFLFLFQMFNFSSVASLVFLVNSFNFRRPKKKNQETYPQDLHHKYIWVFEWSPRIKFVLISMLQEFSQFLEYDISQKRAPFEAETLASDLKLSNSLKKYCKAERNHCSPSIMIRTIMTTSWCW